MNIGKRLARYQKGTDCLGSDIRFTGAFSCQEKHELLRMGRLRNPAHL